MPAIKLVSFHFRFSEFLQPLAETIQRIVGWSVDLEPLDFDYSYAFHPERRQYHSSQILLGIKNLSSPGQNKMLAVTDLDLFIPILTFVFGEAQLDGPTAVVSTFRLRPEYYGLPQDNNLVLQRLIKECIHEIGHTFGLVHCWNPGCVLNASTYVEEIDLKTDEFCRDCKRNLGRAQEKLL